MELGAGTMLVLKEVVMDLKRFRVMKCLNCTEFLLGQCSVGFLRLLFAAELEFWDQGRGRIWPKFGLCFGLRTRPHFFGLI